MFLFVKKQLFLTKTVKEAHLCRAYTFKVSKLLYYYVRGLYRRSVLALLFQQIPVITTGLSDQHALTVPASPAIVNGGDFGGSS